jgi:hypothetical protein
LHIVDIEVSAIDSLPGLSIDSTESATTTIYKAELQMFVKDLAA